jgi:hypothetical protein
VRAIAELKGAPEFGSPGSTTERKTVLPANPVGNIRARCALAKRWGNLLTDDTESNKPVIATLSLRRSRLQFRRSGGRRHARPRKAYLLALRLFDNQTKASPHYYRIQSQVTFIEFHWTDPTSLETLGRTVDRLRILGVLLIITYRPEFDAPWIGRPYATALNLNRVVPVQAGAHDF